MGHWYVYIAECADQTFYIGATNDIDRRIDEHNSSPKGARYTKSRRPVSLRYMERHDSKSGALIREIALKRLTRAQKESLIDQGGLGTL